MILLLLFLPSATCSPLSDTAGYTVEVLTTDPYDQNRNRELSNKIIDEILSAKDTIRLALYNFDHDDILAALSTARQNGVQVKITGDLTQLDTPGYQALNHPPFFVVTGNRQGIQHNKFIVIDDHTVVTGTGNFTLSGFHYNYNNFLIIHDREVARIYTDEFEQLYSGVFGSQKRGYRKNLNLVIDQMPAALYFSPQDGAEITRAIIEKIEKAKHTIHYMIFAFTSNEISQALIQAARRGVKVYGIHDSNFITGISQEGFDLYTAGKLNPLNTGPFVREEQNTEVVVENGVESGGKMHCKTIIIDYQSEDATIITGSFNWSSSAINDNDENLVILQNKKIALPLFHQWEKGWSNSLPPERYRSINTGTTTISPGELVINEISTPLSDGKIDPYPFFIELKNRSTRSVDLSGWRLQVTPPSHSGQLPVVVSFPNKTNHSTTGAAPVIQPGSFLVLLNPSAKKLIQAKTTYNVNLNLLLPGSKINLFSPSADLIDHVALPPDENQTENHYEKTTRSFARDSTSSRWGISVTPCPLSTCPNQYIIASPGAENDQVSDNPLTSVELDPQNGDLILSFLNPPDQCATKQQFLAESPTQSFTLSDGTIHKNTIRFKRGPTPLPQGLYQITINRSSGEKPLSLVENTELIAMTPSRLLRLSPGAIMSRHGNLPEGLTLTAIKQTLAGLYIGTTSGLYLSTDNGATALPVATGPTPGEQAIRSIQDNGSLTLVAAEGGIFASASGLSSFQKIWSPAARAPGAIDAAPLPDKILVAYGKTIEQLMAISPYTTIARTDMPGLLHSLFFNGSTLVAGTTTGAYYSNDLGLTFTPLTNPGSDITSIQWIPPFFYLNNSTELYTYQPDTSLLTSGVLTHQINSLVLSNLQPQQFFAATPTGIYKGPSPDNLTPINTTPCNNSKDHLTGRGTFEIPPDPPPYQTATLRLNEVFIKSPGFARDFIELYTENGGFVGKTLLYRTEGARLKLVARLPALQLNKGDLVVIYLTGSDLVSPPGLEKIINTRVVSLYATDKALAENDAILYLQTPVSNSGLYYSNRDHHIDNQFIESWLKNIFYSKSPLHNIAPGLHYPSDANHYLLQLDAANL